MSDDVTLTIDGQTVTVPKGTVVVEAARKIQNLIPVFCYHPKMAPVGMCRMCLVKIGTPKIDRATNQPELGADGKPVIAMMPRLQTACTTPVSEGMVVVTADEEVKHAQNGVLEALLTSHPLDCPVCDKGGECPLQNLTMGWGPSKTRFDYQDKVHFEKPIPLGELIYLDRERCILCARCVRFQDEIAGDPVLGFDHRGRNWQIISMSDPPFDSKFSGNTTDICPVGALTSADFRFKARVWELEPIPTVCNHCPVGCNMTFDMRSNEIKRVMPRENNEVNEIWLCDRGRFGHHFVGSGERLTTPLLRRNGRLEPATWEQALEYVAQNLDGIRSSAGGKAIGGLAGPALANEDLFAFQRFFRETLGSNNIDHRPGTALDLPLDTVGSQFGLTKGTNLLELGKGTVVLVFGADPEEEAPVHLLRIRGIVNRGGTLITANGRPTKLDQDAKHKLPYRYGSEAALLAALLKPLYDSAPAEGKRAALRGFADLRGQLQNAGPANAAESSGAPAEAIAAVSEAIAGAQNLVIVYGRDALSAGPNVTGALANLLLLARKAGERGSGLLALVPGANSRGALDLGVRPDRGPGYANLSQPGMDARQMLAAAQSGKLKALYVAGLDPAGDDPATVAALKKVDLLVVQELFLTETAKLADVVLPALSVAEREGTFTNAERRVQRFRQARRAAASLRPDWQIIQSIARQLTADTVLAATASAGDKSRKQVRRVEEQSRKQTVWNYASPAEILMDIQGSVAAYRGVTYAALQGPAGQWGRQENENYYFDGTSYENTGGVGVQLPAAAETGALPIQPFKLEIAGRAGAERPFILAPAAFLYDDSALLQASDLLENRRAKAVAALHPADADALGVKTGDSVTVTSGRGSVTLAVNRTKLASQGAVVVPLGVKGAALSQIVEGHGTAVSVRRAEG
ncbi:MAG TPA: NADH-quinone oxidoreductase subunit NuoG [Herpetosiphonaceae bacterium]